MSDVPAAGVAAESTNAPAVEAAAAAPVAEAASVPAVAETAPAPAAVEAPAAAAPAIDAESRAPSLLSGETKTETPPGEAPVEGAAPAEEAKPAEIPAEPVPLTYEKFAVPEGLSLDDERVAPFVELIAPLRVPQEQAQQLVDLHIAEMQRYADQSAREQHRVFADMRKGWVERFESDPEIGGNRRDTTVGNALWAINELGGDADQVRELREMLSFTGAGDHPALIRLMHNVATRLRERSVPPPGLPPRPGGGGRPEDRRYPNM